MKQAPPSRVLNNVVSPYGLAIVSYAFFLFSCLLPPSIYTGYMHEPDLMFLDPVVILFFTLCVAGFIAGVWLISWLVPDRPLVDRELSTKVSPAVYLLVPLVLCVSLTAFSISLIVAGNPLAILILMSQQGNLLTPTGDANLELHGTMNISVLFVSGVVWWSFWRYHQLGTKWRGKHLVRIVQLLAVVVVLAFTSLILSKHLVTVLVTGLVICYLMRKRFLRQLNWNLLSKTVLLFAVAGSAVFFFVSFLKGALDPETQIEGFIGYTISSYNRLAALLHGVLRFEYSGRGINFSNFLSFNNFFNRFVPFRELLSIPDFYNWWWSEFESVGRAGLNSSLIFCGTFGDLFIEIGWFAPLYLLFYGVLYGLLWRWMLSGRLIGLVLYPYCAYCILFWFSTNGLFDQDIVALILDALLLAVYELILLNRARAPVLQTA
jgi:hypothetical protein